MITRLEVSNYKSIGANLRLDLGRLTALVGPNGSGKSNLADVLQFVSEALRDGLDAAVSRRGGFAAIRRRHAESGEAVSIRMEGERNGDPFEYGMVLDDDLFGGYRVRHESVRYSEDAMLKSITKAKSGIKRGLDEKARVHRKFEFEDKVGLMLPLLAGRKGARPLAGLIRGIAIYSIFPDTLRKPQVANTVKPMFSHGTNWCSILEALTKEVSSPELVAALGQLTGDIDGVRVQQIGGYLVTEFRHGETTDPAGGRVEHWHDAGQESDGTLRMAGILTALLQEPPPTLIGIEEPELTIHPGALPLLYDYLKEASGRSQVLVTTHSPELLSLFAADDVRVVERRGGTTTVSPMDETQRGAVRDRLFTLGDLMRMEGLRQAAPGQTSPAGG